MEIKTNGFKLPSGDIHVFIPPEPTETDRGGIKASEKTTESLEVKYDKKTGKLFSPTSPTDNTLTESNVAADAKKTGDEFARVNNNMESKLDKQQGAENAGKAMVINPEGVIVPGEVTGGDGIPIINTASGESPLVVSDSAERVNKGLSIIGNTEQLTTTGANLFDEKKLLNFDDPNYDKSNASKGVFYYKFKADEQVTVSVTKLNKDGEYLCVGAEPDGSDAYWLSHKSAATNTFKTLTPKDGYIYLGVGTTLERVENMIRKTGGIMINHGSVAMPYEPYTGGKPSPSPEYPQEIKNVGKWNEEKQKYDVDVKVTGKNLLNTYEKAEKDSEFYSVNGDGSLNQKKADDRSFLTVPETLFLRAGKYYFSLFDTGVIFELYNADANKFLLTIETQESVLVDLEKDTNIKYKVFALSGTANNVRVMVSINKETDYVPCKEPQTLTLTSDRPITKWDKLIEQDGQIGWLYKHKNITLNGGEIWKIHSNNMAFYTEFADSKFQNSFCDKYKHKFSAWAESEYGIYSDNNNAQKYFRPPHEGFEMDIDVWKAFLNNNPLTVICESMSTEFVPLPQSEQDAIRALKTYYPTTVISVDGGEVDPDIEVTYTADTKNYIDQKIAPVIKSVVETQKALL